MLVGSALFAIVAPVVVALIATALTSALASAAPLAVAIRRPHGGPALRFGIDTFAFRNDSRIHHRGKPDLYANWCFVIARAVVQFQRFARFDPHAPRLAPAEYTALVRRVTRRPAWWAPLPPDQRIVVPGFASLHELTREMEPEATAGDRGRLWTLGHWSNWRIDIPHPDGLQERVASEMVAELQRGQPVQLLITDFPRIELNHSVLAYDYTVQEPGLVDFIVFDPNDPTRPGVVRFDPEFRRFRPAPLTGVAVSYFRAFRQYGSPLY
jgi:hypothetical protein